MEALPGLWALTPIGGMLGMIALLYWLLATGRMVTKSSHDNEVRIYQEIIVTKDATIDRLTDQNGKLLAVASTIQGVLQYAPNGGDAAQGGSS